MSTFIKLQEVKVDKQETTEKMPKTYLFDSALNVITGLVIHQVYYFFNNDGRLNLPKFLDLVAVVNHKW